MPVEVRELVIRATVEPPQPPPPPLPAPSDKATGAAAREAAARVLDALRRQAER